MDPKILKYFKKIISSFTIGFLWLFTVITMGIYFQLGLLHGTWHWYNLLFYLCTVLTLLWLLSFYFKLWKD